MVDWLIDFLLIIIWMVWWVLELWGSSEILVVLFLFLLHLWILLQAFFWSFAWDIIIMYVCVCCSFTSAKVIVERPDIELLMRVLLKLAKLVACKRGWSKEVERLNSVIKIFASNRHNSWFSAILNSSLLCLRFYPCWAVIRRRNINIPLPPVVIRPVLKVHNHHCF